MTDARAAAEVLAQAHARRGTRAPRYDAAASSPPADEPRPNSPADVGHVAAPARARRPAPPTDREVLAGKPKGIAFEGVELTDIGFRVTLRRPDGRAHWCFRATEGEALRAAREWIEALP